METGRQILSLSMAPRREAWWAVFEYASEDLPVWEWLANPVDDAVREVAFSVRDRVCADALLVRRWTRAGTPVTLGLVRESSMKFTPVWARHWADVKALVPVRRRVQEPVRDAAYPVWSQLASEVRRRVRLITCEEERHAR